MPALVLVDAGALPNRVGEVRVAVEAGVAVPMGEPDRVECVGRVALDLCHVAHARRRAAVHGRRVASVAETRDPSRHECRHRVHAGAVARVVGLHVEVDGRATPKSQRVRLVHRVRP